MKMGFLSAILDGWSFEETISFASDCGFSCVEVACWPRGASDRRYAGVSHIDATDVSDASAQEIRALCAEKNVEISSLAYYPNPMDGDPEKRAAAVRHLESVMAASAKLGVNMVTTFVGRDQRRDLEENIELFKSVWPPLIGRAEEFGVRVAIENCPMLFGPEQWPGGQNLFTSPKIWRRIFEIIPSPNFGINFDPSHFVWQGMDYIAPIYEFKDRIFHIHFKDIKIHLNRLRETGVMAFPLEYMSPKLPGLGDVDWGAFISALNDVGYGGPACIEIEDRTFEGSRERIMDGLRLSKRFLGQFLI